MIKKIDHIGIAVADLDGAMRRYEAFTGVRATHEETIEEQKVDTAFFPVDEVRLELLKGTTPDSPVSKFIEKRGEGIHHICFEVDDLESTKEQLDRAGFLFIAQQDDRGAGGTRVAFIHPKSTGGILFELVEYPKS